MLALLGDDLADAHTETLYDGTGIQATALFMPDQVVDLAAGDVFKVGVRIETDDTGRGRIRVTAVAFRNRCLNLLIIGEGTVETVSQVHRGSTDRMRAVLEDGVARARASIAPFLEAWGHARAVKALQPRETFEEWLRGGKLPLPGPRTDEGRRTYLDELLASFRKEPGDSLADLVNALSRAAHEVPAWPQTFREDLERQAGRLVMNLV